MPHIQLVYAFDPKVSGSSPRQTSEKPLNGRVINFKQERPDDYRKILEPKKGPGRLEFHPNLPKTLTPKGYTKLKLMMSVANKQYDSLVRRLKREGALWEDPEFPANDSSIGMDELRYKVDWKRPKEINPNAEFMVGGASRFDIEQGQLGDCWLLAVVSSISSYPDLFQHIVPPNQSIKTADYVGVFRLRFWRFGEWVEVLVDDRLPVKRGTNQLIFMHSAEQNEFWSALLEKAYAKLNGCYGHLVGGSQSEAMEDLTGGMCQTVYLDPSRRPRDLVKQMVVYANRCCLMGVSITSETREPVLPNGLIGGHAYSVTAFKQVTYRNKIQYLVRCRNPWGDYHEWKGAWADKSPEWNYISPAEKRTLEVTFRDDGEFWMSYEDFVTNFSQLEVCHLGLESLERGQSFRGKFRLEESIFSGQWQKNISAGGCINNRNTFWTNPQFRISVVDPDPNDDEHMCTIVIGLMQKDVRRKQGGDFNVIGFMVFQDNESHEGLLKKSQLLTKPPVGKSTFANLREVTGQFRLKPGSYVIIPSTFDPNIEANFILRVISEVPLIDKELDDSDCRGDVAQDLQDALRNEELIINEDDEMIEKFHKLCDPTTKAINSIQLRNLLNNSSLQDIPNFKGIDKEISRSMVASVDNNLTGTLELQEFMNLWQQLKWIKICFLSFDEEGNGSFDTMEFRTALQQMGYSVSNMLFNALVHRYQDPGTDRMGFEDFALCCIRLSTVFETVTAQPKTNDGVPMFTPNDFLRFSVYI